MSDDILDPAVEEWLAEHGDEMEQVRAQVKELLDLAENQDEVEQDLRKQIEGIRKWAETATDIRPNTDYRSGYVSAGDEVLRILNGA